MHQRTYFPNDWSQMWDISGTLKEYTMAVPYPWVLSKPQLIKGSHLSSQDPFLCLLYLNQIAGLIQSVSSPVINMPR